MHGKGIYNFKDGGKYECQFVEGKYLGFGMFLWFNGSVYYGYFE